MTVEGQGNNSPLSLRMDHSFLRWDALRDQLASNSTTLRYNQRPGSTVVRVEEDTALESDLLASPIRLIHIPCAFGLSSRGYPLSNLLTSAKAAMMAAYDFNHRRQAIVPHLEEILQGCDVHLTLDFYDTARDVVRGATVLTEYIQPQPFPYQATAVVGAVRSAVSIPMAILNSISGIPQISYASTSSELDSRDSYPLFGRVLPSTVGDAAAALDYFVNVLGTTHLGILYVQDSYGTAYQLSLEGAANQMDVETTSVAIDWSNETPDFESNMRKVIERLKQTGYKHFMGIIYRNHLSTFVRLAKDVGVVGPGNIWLLGDGISRRTISNACAESEDPLAYHGMGIIAVGNPIDGTQTDRFMTQYNAFDEDEEFREYFSFKSPLKTDDVVFLKNTTFNSPSHFAPLMYDAVMSIGIAACQAESEFFDGTDLFNSFMKSEFVGASGPVLIDETTGSRRFNSSAYVVTGTKVHGPTEEGEFEMELYAASGYVGKQLSDGSFQNKWLVPEGVQFNYSDFTLQPPPPLPPVEITFSPIAIGAQAVALSMASLVTLSAIGFAFWTVKHRREYVVRASQPGFLLIVGLGCFLMSASVLFIVADSPPMPENLVRLSCMFGYWPFSIGFSLAFGGLFAKTWRINKILGAGTSFRRIVVSPREVILPSAIFLAGNLIILTLWQIMAPLQFERVIDEDGSVDEYGRPNSSVATCEAESALSSLFLLILFILNGIAVVAANVQVYRARHIQTEFSESRYISIAMAITLQSLLIAMPVFLLGASQTTSAVARSFVVILCSGSILFLVFVPKILYLRAHKKEASERNRRLAERRSASADVPILEDSSQSDAGVNLSNHHSPPELAQKISEEYSGNANSCLDKRCIDGHGTPTGLRRRSKSFLSEEIGMEVIVAEPVRIPRRKYSDSSSGLRISSAKSSSEFRIQSPTASMAGNSGPFGDESREVRSGEISVTSTGKSRRGGAVRGSSGHKSTGTVDGRSGSLSQSSSRRGSVEKNQDISKHRIEKDSERGEERSANGLEGGLPTS